MHLRTWWKPFFGLFLLVPTSGLASAGKQDELFIGGEAAIVLDLVTSGQPDLAPFDLLKEGKIIRLHADESILLGYEESCIVERITGGTVAIGKTNSKVVGGSLVQEQIDCDLFRYRHTADQLQFAAVSIMEQKNKAPRGQAPPNHRYSVAVVIGNKAYKGDIPQVSYAHRDADAMKRYLVDVLGYAEDNIIDLRDATQSDIETALGNTRSHEGLLWRRVRPGRSHIAVFYSGHGVPGLNDRRGYLLPVDVEPNDAEISGYPIELLYENLSRLEAKSAMVFLDACFSGNSNSGMLVRSASPVFIQTKMPDAGSELTVFTAATAEQVASWDDKKQYGLFTYYLLQALQGEADKPPFGNEDGVISVSEVSAYLDEEMTFAARRAFGRRQNASVDTHSDVVLAAVPKEQPDGLFRPPLERQFSLRAPGPAAAVRTTDLETYEVHYKAKRSGWGICSEPSGTFEIEVVDGKIVSSTLEHAPVRGTIGEFTASGNFGVAHKFHARRDGDRYRGEWQEQRATNRVGGCQGWVEIVRKIGS